MDLLQETATEMVVIRCLSQFSTINFQQITIHSVIYIDTFLIHILGVHKLSIECIPLPLMSSYNL